MADLGTMIATLGVTTKGVQVAQRTMIQMLNQINSRLDQTNAKLNSMGTVAGTAVTKNVVPAITKVIPATDAAVKSFDKLAVSWSTTAQRFRTFGYMASAMVTLPIVMMGKSVIQTASDFEFSMAKIVGLVGMSKREVDKFSESILKMAPALAQMPQSLAEAFYFITSAGFKNGTEAMDILTISAKAATAGLGETADIAKLLVFSMNAYKASGLTAAKVVDMMTVAVREGAIEAEGFASAIQQIIPVAAAMGLSLGQVMGSMAAMSLQGANAANSAVYLKGILNSLMKIKPTNQAGKALAELGSSALKLRAQLASGPNGLMNVLLQIQEWSKTNPYLLNKVFGNIRAMTGDLSLMGQNLKANQKIINLVVNAEGDLALATAAVADTIKVRMNRAMASLKSDVTEFGKSVGSYLIPVMEWLVRQITSLMTWFNNLGRTFKGVIVFVAAFTAVLGPLSLLLSFHMYIVAGLIEVYGKLRATIVSVKTFLMGATAPYLALAAAVVALGIVIVHLIKKTNPLKKMYKELNTEIASEVFSLNSLFSRLKSTTVGTQEHTSAINMANSRYGDYLDKLLTEKSTLKDIEEAQKTATAALVANISVKQYTAELEKQRAAMASSTEKYFGDMMNEWSKTFGPDRLGEFITGLNSAVDEAIAAGMEKTSTGAWKSFDVFKKFYNEYVFKMAKFTGNKKLAFTPVSEAFYGFLRIMEPATKTMDELNAKIKAFGSLGKYSIGSVAKMTSVLGPSLKNLGKILGGIGGGVFQTMGDALNNIAGSLGYVNDGVDDLDEGLETTDTVWKKMTEELESLKVRDKIYQEIGKPFDLSKEKAELFISTMDKLTAEPYNLNIDDSKIRTLVGWVKSLNIDFSGTEKALDTLKASLAAIDMKRLILGADFDANSAKIEVYKKVIDSYVDVITDPKNKGSKIVGLFSGIDILANIAVVKKLSEEQRKLIVSQQLLEDTKMLGILQAEADAFGGMAGKVEVLNYTLRAAQRHLRNMFIAKEMGSPLNLEEVKKTVDEINHLKLSLVDAQNAMDIQYLTDMNNALGTVTTGSDLLSSRISALQNALKELSATGQGNTEMFKALAEQMQNFILAQTLIDSLSGAFTELFDVIIDSGRNMEEVLNDIMRGLLKEIMAYIAKLIAIKIITSIITGGTVGKVSSGLKIGQPGGIFGIPIFAKGGIVPRGYPNDTYPALLTSGETVLPKEIRDIVAPVYQFEDVKFVIEDNQLVGILKKSDNKKANY